MPDVGHPDFKEMLGIIPSEVGREIDLSFDIAARIHEVLVRKGWSQADFARNAGKKEAEISKWMSGQHNFTIRTIAFIENLLGEEILSVKGTVPIRLPQLLPNSITAPHMALVS